MNGLTNECVTPGTGKINCSLKGTEIGESDIIVFSGGSTRNKFRDYDTTKSTLEKNMKKGEKDLIA